MKVGTFSKQPGERLSHSINYIEALDEGDTIAAILSCVTEPADLSVTAALATTTRVRLFSEGGTSGVTYKTTVTVETNNGERFEDEVICKVKEL